MWTVKGEIGQLTRRHSLQHRMRERIARPVTTVPWRLMIGVPTMKRKPPQSTVDKLEHRSSLQHFSTVNYRFFLLYALVFLYAESEPHSS
jgi:hypothetical protein